MPAEAIAFGVVHLAGFTPQEIFPQDDRTIMQYGYGLTAVVDRPTARADQLSMQRFIAAAASFERKIARYAPRFVAFLGKAAYSALSGQREVAWGAQPAAFGNAVAWVLPNPSGRNRAFTLDQLVNAYRQFHLAVIWANFQMTVRRPSLTAGHDGFRGPSSQHCGAMTERSVSVQVLTILPSLP